MAFYNWLKYGKSGTTVEIIIRDDGGGKLDSFKFHSRDKKTIKKVFKTIKMKYGIDFVKEIREGDKDLDWLK